MLHAQPLVERVDERPDPEVERAAAEAHDEGEWRRLLQHVGVAPHGLEHHPLRERDVGSVGLSAPDG